MLNQTRRLPPAILRGINDYVERRNVPGSFLRSVLENNLLDACAHADSASEAALTSIVAFIHQTVPAVAWGNPDNVAKWLAKTDAFSRGEG